LVRPGRVDDYAKIAQTELDKILADAGAANSGVTVTQLLRQGQPADILCAEAKGADLLIVGSRGLGGFGVSPVRRTVVSIVLFLKNWKWRRRYVSRAFSVLAGVQG
jgi:nucleotide-binding universal stress UspA family protein